MAIDLCYNCWLSLKSFETLLSIFISVFIFRAATISILFISTQRGTLKKTSYKILRTYLNKNQKTGFFCFKWGWKMNESWIPSRFSPPMSRPNQQRAMLRLKWHRMDQASTRGTKKTNVTLSILSLTLITSFTCLHMEELLISSPTCDIVSPTAVLWRKGHILLLAFSILFLIVLFPPPQIWTK